MPVSDILGYLLLGSLIGILSGMLGIGGGVLVIPALVFFFGFTHKQAVGTSLGMMLPPIGILAVIQYHHAGQVKIVPALLLSLAFMGGAWLGAYLASGGHVPERALRVAFAFFIIYIAGNMLFRSERRVWAVLETFLLMTLFAITHLLFRTIGKRWDREFSADEIYRRRVQVAMAPDYEI